MDPALNRQIEDVDARYVMPIQEDGGQIQVEVAEREIPEEGKRGIPLAGWWGSLVAEVVAEVRS